MHGREKIDEKQTLSPSVSNKGRFMELIQAGFRRYDGSWLSTPGNLLPKRAVDAKNVYGFKERLPQLLGEKSNECY